jgi:HK97 family phage major capsid protein
MSTPLTAREQLEKLIPEMVDYTEKAVNKEGGATAEERETIEKMSADISGLLATAKTESESKATANAAKGYLAELGASAERTSATFDLDAAASKSGIVNPNGMTLGEAFAKSPAYQQFVSQYRGSDGVISNVPVMKAAGFQADTFYAGSGSKALITGLSDTSAGAFVTTQRLGNVADLIGERRLYVRDLCTNITINSDTFDFVTVTGKTNAAAPVLEATTSATPGLNNVAVGAYTAAHGVKPESALTFAVVSSIVETIAHLIPITRRAAADGGQVRQMVDAFLFYGLREEEEDQILNGSGTTPNLRGILNTVGINTVGSAGTDIDAIVDGIAAIRADMNEPTAMVVHPNDWYSTGFLLAKDSAGNYLVGDPRANLDQLNSLWGLRVVVTPAMTENTVLIGDFRKAVVADRMQATLFVTDSHNDWFARNLLAILAEERLGFGVLDPEAFCTVTAV